MRLGSRKENRKTATLTMRILPETKRILMQVSEDTQAKSVVSLIEGLAEGLKSGRITLKDLEVKSAGKNEKLECK